VFEGGPGNDHLDCTGCSLATGGGTFLGGSGADSIGAMAGGRFEGGPGADVVDDFVSGVCVSASGCQA